MRDENHFAQAQRLNDGFEVAKLLPEAVSRTGRFVGRTKAKEIERDDAPSRSGQIGDQVVIDAQIIGKAVHEHEGRSRAAVVAGVDLALAPVNALFDEWLAVHLADLRTHDSTALATCSGSSICGQWPADSTWSVAFFK